MHPGMAHGDSGTELHVSSLIRCGMQSCSLASEMFGLPDVVGCCRVATTCLSSPPDPFQPESLYHRATFPTRSLLYSCT